MEREQAGGVRDFLYSISPGNEGIRETLYLMRRLVRDGKRSPEVITAARQITRTVPNKDWHGEVQALFDYVRRSIRYVQDPADLETLTTPERLMEIGAGDCDDMAILLASLLEAINYKTRFVAVGERPGNMQHVFVEVQLNMPAAVGGWVALDPTEPHPMGWAPENVFRGFIVNN